MNITELAKKRKEEQAIAEQTAEANALIAAAKQENPGSVSVGMMGSADVAKDTEGAGDKPSANVESNDKPEHTVTNEVNDAQDANAGVLHSKGIDASSLAPGVAIDPGTRERFVVPNPLLVREVIPEIPAVKGPSGSFRALRLQRFFAPDGTKIVPSDDGFYRPQNEWEHAELIHYAQQYGMVEYQE